MDFLTCIASSQHLDLLLNGVSAHDVCMTLFSCLLFFRSITVTSYEICANLRASRTHDCLIEIGLIPFRSLCCLLSFIKDMLAVGVENNFV